MSNDTAGQIAPDTKDWTWVLDRPCPECGYDAADIAPQTLADRIRASAQAWRAVLDRDDAQDRPRPDVWSPAEYACHVRDMHRVFAGRVALMRDADGATFPSWDQNQTALDDDYASQAPARVLPELLAAADGAAAAYESLSDAEWQHRGQRSNGSEFTVVTLGRYQLHDAVHHLVDVAG